MEWMDEDGIFVICWDGVIIKCYLVIGEEVFDLDVWV